MPALITHAEFSKEFYLFLCPILFTIGAIGLMIRKNMIVMLMCIELMLNSVNLLLVSFGNFFGQGDAHIFVFFIVVVAAAEATVGLSILILAYRNKRNIDADLFNNLNG